MLPGMTLEAGPELAGLLLKSECRGCILNYGDADRVSLGKLELQGSIGP